ncbi:MAG: hypothetical protein GEU78_15275 [Actinobacteria bacterium]|nr:hypothetical protein [Actinomycetota bacterium]
MKKGPRELNESEGFGMGDFDQRLREAIRRDAERVSKPSPKLRDAISRGRRIRAFRRTTFSGLTVVLVIGLLIIPGIDFPDRRRSELGVQSARPGMEAWENDRAASFAVRAAGDAGLLDPTGHLYDYQGIEHAEGNWIVTFEVWDCSESVGLGRCGDAFSEATLGVTIEDGRLSVSDAAGPMDENSRERLLRYGEPFEPEAPGFQFPYVEVTQFKGGSTGLQGSMLWTGPIPYTPNSQSEEMGRCQAEIRNQFGEVVYSGSAGGGEFVPLTPPATEELRSGGLSGVPVPAAMAEISGRVKIVCELAPKESLEP